MGVSAGKNRKRQAEGRGGDLARIGDTWIGCVWACLLCATASAAGGDPGFVAGDAKPQGDGPFVEVPGGWMTPYIETIPGTEVTFRMIPIPGGTFRMGSPDAEAGRTADEGPTFEVTVEPFWMGQHEVTWGEYKQYMDAYNLFLTMSAAHIRPIDDSNEADAVTSPTPLYDASVTYMNGEDDDLPAVTMTQFAARQYTKWLSGLTGRFHRIPAESEWEYACRAGADTPFSCGDGATLDDVAWFADNSDDTPHPVGQKKPNAFGLYDMHGNVAEWVVDELFAGGYVKPAALPKPVTVTAAIQWPLRLYPRVLRGGAYYDDASDCRSASRKGSKDFIGDDDAPGWKYADQSRPISPWWYTEEPSLGVGMRIMRPLVAPADIAARRRWWEADEESMKADVHHRLKIDGRANQGIVDPELPEDLKKARIWP